MIDFTRILKTLSEGEVQYILVGGAAGIAHGASRLTQDIDVVYRRDQENHVRICKALEPFHPYLRGAPPGLPFVLDAETLKRGLNFTLTTSLGDLDLLGEITGEGNYEALLPNTILLDVFSQTCRCIDLPALIRAKRATGRPRDLDAVAELEAIRDERG